MPHHFTFAGSIPPALCAKYMHSSLVLYLILSSEKSLSATLQYDIIYMYLHPHYWGERTSTCNLTATLKL